MADIKTFGSFKDYLLITLLGAVLYFATNTYMIVTELAIKDAVRDAIELEEKKWKAAIESRVSVVEKEQQEEIKFRAKMDDYIKPNETRAQRRIVER